MPPEFYHDVYTLLESEGQILTENRDFFVYYFTQEKGIEYRFCGTLGFGGKFYNSGGHRIGCYPEDVTPERAELTQRLNNKVKELERKYRRKGSK